ncbi:MAG: hypothetical protein AB8G18_19035 [Gammaproteobacteria bacterium]
MFGNCLKALSLGLSVACIAACSPAPEDTTLSNAQPNSAPITFAWDAPARLNVRETTQLKGKAIKLKYDLMVEPYDELKDHLFVSFTNVTPIEFEGEQVLVSTYPAGVRANMKLIMADYYTRPDFIVSPDGQVVGFPNVDDSLRTFEAISQAVSEEMRSRLYGQSLSTEALRDQMKSSSDAVWTCLVGAWLDFKAQSNESVEQTVSLFVVEGADPVPGTYLQTHRGLAENSSLFVELERTTFSTGNKLVRLMQELVQARMGNSGELPDIEGVATAVDRRTDKVRLNPANMKPQWARCEAEFTIDSKDESVLPSTSTINIREFDIQWL